MKALRIFLLVLITIGIGLLLTQSIWVPKLVNKILSSETTPVVLQTSPKEIKNNVKDLVGGVKGVSNPKPNTYEWCMANGGKGYVPKYNGPKKCLVNNQLYENDCISNDKYFVTSKDLGPDSVGTDALVKYKSSPSQIFACEYSVGGGDFVIKNEWAEYLMALENNFLILDSGTGPDPRGLIIYDLEKRKKVYTDEYFDPVVIQNNTINYWSPTNQKATTENCPNFLEYEKNGIGAEGIDTHVILDLLTLSKKDLGEYRCTPRQ